MREWEKIAISFICLLLISFSSVVFQESRNHYYSVQPINEVEVRIEKKTLNDLIRSRANKECPGKGKGINTKIDLKKYFACVKRIEEVYEQMKRNDI